MANLNLRNRSFMESIKRVCDRFVKDSMPSTIEEAAGYTHNVEDYEMLYDVYSELEDLTEAYASKIEKMSDQLDDIQKRLINLSYKLDEKE